MKQIIQDLKKGNTILEEVLSQRSEIRGKRSENKVQISEVRGQIFED